MGRLAYITTPEPPVVKTRCAHLFKPPPAVLPLDIDPPPLQKILDPPLGSIITQVSPHPKPQLPKGASRAVVLKSFLASIPKNSTLSQPDTFLQY